MTHYGSGRTSCGPLGLGRIFGCPPTQTCGLGYRVWPRWGRRTLRRLLFFRQVTPLWQNLGHNFDTASDFGEKGYELSVGLVVSNKESNMQRIFFAMLVAFATSFLAHAAEWTPHKEKESDFTGRKLDTFTHSTKAEWGYDAPQNDTFLVLHPSEPRENAPLYVVLHSAGHDVHSCLNCTATVGNHDIYHAPKGFYALYLDCRANKGDWWWGSEKYKGPEVCPTEKRVIDTVKWVIEHYGIDANRVYLCGNSMGGSGTLGIGMRHGDLFAAIKANVPARVEHVSSRMYFPPEKVPADLKLPDPPIAIDYSAPNDGWSKGHDAFAKAMNDRKYALFMYWGPFGHANNHEHIRKVNDLVDSFDWLSVKKNEAYPVFTNASSNDPLPWPDRLDDKKSGQINAFFRWKNVSDTAEKFKTSLFLINPEELKTTFAIPAEATADVSLRRLQQFRIASGQTVSWSFGSQHGDATADADGCVTIEKLKITAEPATLEMVIPE